MHALKKRIVSVVLLVSMILTMLPSTMLTYAAEQKYTPEKLIEQGNAFYELKNQSGAAWTPMSLTPFTLKAAEVKTKVNYNKADKSQYVYAALKDGKRFNKDNPDYHYYNLLGEADHIFDLIADGSDSKTLQACVENLFLEQRADDQKEYYGLFTPDGATPNAFIEARIILALDAYYGTDPEQSWKNPSKDPKPGRIAAVKALTQLWDSANLKFKGYSIIPYQNGMGVTTGFKLSDSKDINVAFPIVALSSYTDSTIIIDDQTGETLGDLARTAISKGLATLEGLYLKNQDGLSNYNNFIYLTPALLSIDGMEVDANVLPTMGNVKVDSSNHKVDAEHLIKTYGLINGLNDLTVYAADGGLWTGNNNFKENAREFLTQQCVIAASDMIHGETAWKRIVSPNAKDRNDVAADTKAITIPAFTYDSLDLDTFGKSGSQIIWQSSEENIIATNGAVTVPEKGSETVTLTATISKGEAKKEKKFSIVVKSNTKDKAVEVLDRMMGKFDTAYKKDISSLGIDGVVALKSIGRDLEQYKLPQVTSVEGISATECAKAILQIVMTDKNPYDYNHTNYVEVLCKQEIGKGGECAWALLAFDAAGKKIPSDLLEKVTALAIAKETSVQERSTAVYALASHKNEDGVPEALSSAKEAIKNTQKNGIFGADKRDHAYAVSALVSIGEDLSLDQWIQDNQTPFMVLSSEDALNLKVITALGDLSAETSVYQRNIPSRSSFQDVLKEAKNLINSSSGVYSENSLDALKTAYGTAEVIKENESFGESFYDLKTAIKGLTTAQLTFGDADKYTTESIKPFENAVSTLQEKLYQKSATAKELADYAKLVNVAYKSLEKSTSSFNGEKITIPINTPMSFYSMMTAEKAYDLQKQIGQRMLDKTMAGYDAEYGYDVSKLGYWGVFEVCAMGKDISKYKVYDVTTHKSGALTTYQATDFAAIILQLVLTGENPYDYHGINYVDWLLKQDNGQGNFGPYANNIWALMALDAAGAEYNENLITIVTNQARSEPFDIDMRGWALAAIQNHKDKVSDDTINTIVESFKNKMRKTGDSPLNCFTLGCMITGLNAAGVDMATEEWTAENASPLTALEKMQTENGSFMIEKNFQPAFVKDDIIALGDVVQGSNVWQRTSFTQEKLDKAISNAESLLNDTSAFYSDAKIAAVRSALETAKKISDVKGNGKQYFRLLEVIKKLTSITIPSISDTDTYEYATFTQFKSAVTSLSKELAKNESSVGSINGLCEQVVSTYDALKKADIPKPDPVKPTGDMDVFFTLLGDEKHDESKSHVYAQNSSGFDKWIPKTKVTIPVGSTVYDVFDAQLKKANIAYDVSGASNNYVRWIQSPKSGNRMEEFTNGVLSGWMYTINGEHSLGGMKNDVLKNGDNLVWHYTDDYTKEKGSEKWSSNNSVITDKEKVVTTIPTETKLGVEGKATVLVSAKDMSDALKKAMEAVKSAEKGSKKEVNTELKIEVKQDSKINCVETILPASSLKEVADLNKVIITIVTPVGTLSFDKNALSAISTGIGALGDIKISLETVDQSKTPQLKEKSALSRPIYQMRITSGEKSITNFKDGKVTISLPYTLAKDEKAEYMRIYYIDENGNLINIKNTSYDEKTKKMNFVTDHFSYYAIGYEGGKSVSKFKDVKSSDWFYENVMYLVEKGILKGKSEEVFEPNSNITRAEFVQMLYNLWKTGQSSSGNTGITGANVSEGSKSIKEFKDMKEGDWYAPAIAWAYHNDLVQGMTGKDGNKVFAPNAKICRQDMAVIIGNYLEQISKERLPIINDATVFSDDVQIGGYAKNAVYQLQKIGILTGMTKKDHQGNPITIVAPLKEATRAEAAVMVSKLLKR